MKRDLDNKVILGVCSGLGKEFEVNPTLFRLGFVGSTLFFGTGIGIYIILAIIMMISEKDN